MCAYAARWHFSPDSERVRPTLHRHAKYAQRGARRDAGDPEQAAPSIRAGYDSPVCSNTGDAIDRIVAAIDQLASDAHGTKAEVSENELTARVATLWQMVSDLDPELARRTRRYTGSVDGGPSL